MSDAEEEPMSAEDLRRQKGREAKAARKQSKKLHEIQDEVKGGDLSKNQGNISPCQRCQRHPSSCSLNQDTSGCDGLQILMHVVTSSCIILPPSDAAEYFHPDTQARMRRPTLLRCAKS